MDIFNALTEESQKNIVAWEAALPNTTATHYRTMPDGGDFSLVAIAYSEDGTIYDAATFAAYENVSAVLENVISTLESNGPECPSYSDISSNITIDIGKSNISATGTGETVTLSPDLEKRLFLNHCGWFCGVNLHCVGIANPCKKCKSYASGRGKWWKHCAASWG